MGFRDGEPVERASRQATGDGLGEMHLGKTKSTQCGRLGVEAGGGQKRCKMTKKGDRMAQRNRFNLPGERRMVAVGLVEALKLGSCGSFTSTAEKRRDLRRGSQSVSQSDPSRTGAISLAEESKKGAVQGAVVVPMGWTGVGNGLPGDLDVV